MIVVLWGLAALLALLVSVLYFSSDKFAQFGGRPSGERLQRIQSSPQYSDRFQNQIPTSLGSFSGIPEAIRKQFFGPELRMPVMDIPVVHLDGTSFTTDPSSGLRITWLGHSTVLVELEGFRILTDPVWAKRVSPVSILGPTRFHPVPISLDELPPIDAVVISHDHYDHLDMNTVVALAGTGVHFVVPLGIGAHLEKWGIDPGQISDLDWGESWRSEGGDIEITATPARHYSGRGLLNWNQTLWASWVFAGSTKRVYYSGDSGLFPGYEEIGRNFGPFDITLFKMGAYDESWLDIHMNPDQAIDAHLALGGGLLLPTHWGTFNLGYHDWYEPAAWLLREAHRRKISIVIPKPGEIIDPAAPPETEEWWLPDVRVGQR